MLPHITREEPKREIDEGSVVVVDAMPVSWYRKEHLPGACNIPGFPYEDAPVLTERFAPAVLPGKDAAVVVYCSNIPCRNSEFVGSQLIRLGYTNVRAYREGIEDWVSAGLPTERSAAS